jgi:signal transduction histidine kinase
VLAANRELGRLLGRPPSELLNQSFDELLTKASQIFLESHVRPILRRDGEVSELVLKLNGPDDRDIPLLVSIRAQKESATTVHTWALFESRHRNEFERELIHAREVMRQMAQELQDELGLKNRLLTILGHDLRGPVGSSAQLIDLVVGALANGEPIDEALGLVQASMHTTYNLIENLMGWMEGQYKNSSEDSEPVVLHDLLQTVVSWLESQACAKSITLEVQCQPTLGIRTNRRATETIVRNLTSNALKYSRVGGLVILAGHESATGWSIEVRDNGVGVPPEKLAKLFGGARVDSSPGTGHEHGSGLGLMFCSELARSLGGTLDAVNNPAGGSTFCLRVSRA